MPQRTALWLATGALLGTTSCLVPNHPTKQAGETDLKIVNATSQELCEVYVAPHRNPMWGKDWLAQDEHIDAGASRHVGLVPGPYSIRLHNCAGGSALVLYELDVRTPRELVLHEGNLVTAPVEPGYTRTQFPTTPYYMDHARWFRVPSPERSDAGRVRVTLTNQCRYDVRTFYGDQPGSSDGVYATLPAEGFARVAAAEGSVLWLVDEAHAGVANVTLTPEADSVEVGRDCRSLDPTP